MGEDGRVSLSHFLSFRGRVGTPPPEPKSGWYAGMLSGNVSNVSMEVCNTPKSKPKGGRGVSTGVKWSHFVTTVLHNKFTLPPHTSRDHAFTTTKSELLIYKLF